MLVTRGAAGTDAWLEGEVRRFPAYAVRAQDTTGAGDVFHGAFAVACLRGMPLVEAIDFSNAVAAMKCRRLGGRKAIPRSLGEVAAFREATPHVLAGSAGES